MSGSSQGPTTIALTWAPPPPIKVNGNLDHYVIEAIEVATGRSSQYTESSTRAAINSLHPYYVYKLRVAAFTNARGPYTEYISVTTSESGMSVIAKFSCNSRIRNTCPGIKAACPIHF